MDHILVPATQIDVTPRSLYGVRTLTWLLKPVQDDVTQDGTTCGGTMPHDTEPYKLTRIAWSIQADRL